jgi:hypothetical protein
MFVVSAISVGLCVGLICLPFYMHWNWIGVVWFGAMGLTGLCGVFGSATKSRLIKDFLAFLEERIAMSVALIFLSVVCLYLLYLALREVFGP